MPFHSSLKLIRKIFLSLLGIIVGLGVAAYVYLFVDTGAYPPFAIEGLKKYSSASIPPGRSVNVADSLKKKITVDGEWFKDNQGRRMNLRGINLSGNCKLPFAPRITSRVNEGFFESAETVSFVGRPFPVEEADTHFRRLKSWGFQFVRLLVSWEAIEHEGPGKYDTAYLDYLYRIVKKAQDYNINVFIDPHQDVWSRFTGGDGAPLWTLEKAGLDATQFQEAGAAIIHNVRGDPFPKMIWPTNEYKLGAATMFTLFFGGNDFAPQTKADGVAIQDYLQDHYIRAIRQLALKLKELPNVIGFDTLNEPAAGFIGIADLDTLALLRIGPMPTYFQGMVAGDGNTVEVGVWSFELKGSGFKEVKKEFINQHNVKVWRQDAQDIWKQQGVWGYDARHKPVLLLKNYFTRVKGRPVDFSKDYWKPFAQKYARAIHEIDSRWIIFAEPALFTKLPRYSPEESGNMVNAGHWYDGFTMLTLKHISWINADPDKGKLLFGKRNIREYFNRHLGELKTETKDLLGQGPTLMGEFGSPFDLNGGDAFVSGDFSDQEAVLDRSFNAMEANLLNYTLWHYAPDNENAYGDQWNGEDFSVFSLSQQKDTSDLNAGGRALPAVIRPYPYKVSGIALQSFFNKDSREFFLKFNNDLSIQSPTEIFIPRFHFGKGFEAFVTDGKLEMDADNDLLLYFPKGKGEHVIAVRAL